MHVSDSLHERFTLTARRYPDRSAVIDVEGVITYFELDESSNAIACLLSPHVEREQKLVVLRVGRTRHALVGLLGILKAGAAYVPVDPDYPIERRNYIIKDSRATLIVTDGPLEAGEELIGTIGNFCLARRHSERCHFVPEDACYVIYTSGSTGTPKGCVVGHGHVLSLMDSTRSLFDFGPNDVWTIFHSLSFDFSVWEVWGALLYGGCAVVVNQETVKDPEALRNLLIEHRVSVLNQVPSIFGFLVRESIIDVAMLPALRYVIFGGEAVNLDDIRRWLESGVAPNASLFNMYGITETTVHVTSCRLNLEVLNNTPRGTSPIGTPLGHLTISLRDEDGQPISDGTPGEMWISGRGTSFGYLDRPEMTAERFVIESSDGSERRYYRSGDWAIRYAGNYFYVGRRDDQVKLRGYRIELSEVESAIRSFSGVVSCACGIERTNSGQSVLVAYLVIAEYVQVDAKALREYVATSLPAHMRPQRYKEVNGLPLSATGKLDRRMLATVQSRSIR